MWLSLGEPQACCGHASLPTLRRCGPDCSELCRYYNMRFSLVIPTPGPLASFSQVWGSIIDVVQGSFAQKLLLLPLESYNPPPTPAVADRCSQLYSSLPGFSGFPGPSFLLYTQGHCSVYTHGMLLPGGPDVCVIA